MHVSAICLPTTADVLCIGCNIEIGYLIQGVVAKLVKDTVAKFNTRIASTNN